MKHLLVSLLLISSSVAAMSNEEQHSRSTLMPVVYLGKDKLALADTQNKKLYPIQEIPEELIGREKEEALAFLSSSYNSVITLSDGTLKLKSIVRGEGGGPLLGTAAYWTVKVGGYGTYAWAIWMSGGTAAIDMVEISQLIEASAWAAQIAGTLAPTP